jgi:YidC/Oxa1 family membrane protein insertase
MEKRVIAAIGLSVAILFAFQYFDQRRLPQSDRLRPPLKQPVAKSAPATAPPAAAAPSVPTPEAPISQEDTVSGTVHIVVNGPHYRAVLDNLGAAITSWTLKDYRSAKGEAFEMIPPKRDGSTWAIPGALIFDDPAATAGANNERYQVEIPGQGGFDREFVPPLEVRMKLRRGNLEIEKQYRFGTDNYLVDLSLSVRKAGQPLPGRVLIGQDIGPDTEHFMNPSFQLSAISRLAGKVRRDGPPKDEKEVQRVEGDVRWCGLDMHYFAIIAIPQHPVGVFEVQKVPVITTGLDGKEVARNLVRVTVPENGDARYALFIGPKLQSSLEAVPGADLSGVIDYGMFSILVRPLLVALLWIERFVHNYGLAIVILTLVLTLALFPFRLKQMISMKRMAAVQPKIKEIQEKYSRYKRTDPKRAQMNQEVMALYKEHNVNPLGGCLPLILQMPLLFAFYSLLASSIELRQAPFYAWIHDLSAKDPYYLLPIVMGVTMIISQKMTPMTPGSDPTQAKVMMFMPVIFTVMFLNVSSGLNLYFLCSNVFSIAFQKVAERWVGDKRPQSKSRK